MEKNLAYLAQALERVKIMKKHSPTAIQQSRLHMGTFQEQGNNIYTYFLFFQVKIHVEDINDNKPQFEITEMKKSILEHVADGKEIATFHATDPDISDNARFLYSLNDPSGAFEINPHTGSLTMKDGAKFDREKFKNGFVDLVIGTLELKPSVLPLNQDQAQKTAVKVQLN